MNRAGDWLKEANRDLEAAEFFATKRFHEWAAFASHQSAEKALRALDESLQGVPRDHSLPSILKQLCTSISFPEHIVRAAAELSPVYLKSRYPDEFDSGIPADYFTEKSSQGLISYARQILELCRRKLVIGP